ncbi:MAG: class I SAM-dependent methyltransferase, partial [Bacteroidota bacterium]
HSPFVFEFTEAVLEDDRWFYAFSEVEAQRRLWLTDIRKIEVTDFGAGSLVNPGKVRTIGSLARHSANQPLICQMLFKIVQHYKPKTMLELGTSLGFSSAYLAAAALNGRLLTIEGCPKVAELAAENFRRLNIKNITLLRGRFEEKLPEALQTLGKLDFAFVDGNHRKAPTLQYFEQCLTHAHEGSIFIFDDIHWSEEMAEAWAEIKQHPQVRLTLDLFFFGVVFFRKEQKEKEHFTLIPWVWKPWAIGLGDFFSRANTSPKV